MIKQINYTVYMHQNRKIAPNSDTMVQQATGVSATDPIFLFEGGFLYPSIIWSLSRIQIGRHSEVLNLPNWDIIFAPIAGAC